MKLTAPFSKTHLLAFILVFASIGGIILHGTKAANPSINRYTTYEITLPYSSVGVNNVWEDVTATVIYTTPTRSFQVHGFYYQANTWKARVAPDELGSWTWSASVTGPNGTANSSGAFDVVDGGQPGFVQPNPSNARRMVTSDGKPYIPVGIDDCVGSNLFDSSGNMTQGPAFDLSTNVNPDSYFSAFSGAGINLFRLSLDNCAFKVFNTIGAPQNSYSELNSKDLDSFLQKARQYNIRVYLVLFGFSVPYPNATVGSPEMQSVERYVKYMVDRYSPYVDFWELMNETNASTAWVDDISQTIRADDPYKHRISTSWEVQTDPNIEVISPHWYETENESQSDSTAASHINAQRSYNKLIIFGEQGNGTCNWDSRSAFRMRLRLWAAMFDEGSFIFWHTGQTMNYCSGAANLYLGPQERAYIKAVQDFGKTLTSDAAITGVAIGGVPLNNYALTSSTGAWAYVQNYNDHTNPTVGATMTINSPVSGTVNFIRPSDGAVIKKQAISAGSGTLSLPSFVADLAVQITNTPYVAPSDTTPPTVSLTAPANNATVADNALTVSATASDDTAVAGVQFKLDDFNIGSLDTTSPYSISWSPAGLPNGVHTLSAVAYDAAGNSATSSITITINNATLGVTSFSPTSGPVGTTVYITGTRLDLVTNIAFNQGGAVTYNIVSPTQMTAIVPSGSATGQFSLNFGQALSPTAFTVTAGSLPPTINISASPASVASGGSSTITWSTANATSCTASGAWSGSMALSGSQSSGALTVDSTFSLTCTGAGGTVTNFTPVTINATTKPGDLNADNAVDIIDLSILLSNYNTTNAVADINKDGTVNILDLSILLSNFGT